MANVRIIYHGFTNKYARKVIEYLFDKHGWKPVCITGNTDNDIISWTRENFSDCIIQDAMMLRQAQFDYSKIGKPIPIDADIINALSKYALNFLGFLLDTTGWNFSFQERKLFYYDILKYWNTVINILKPDIFVCFTRPHTPAEFSLYLLCKYYYSIDVLYIDPVPLFDRHYHIVGNSIYNPCNPFIDIYQSQKNQKPSAEVMKYLDEVRSENGKTPEYIIKAYEADRKNILFNIKSLLKTFIKAIIFRQDSKLGLFDWKKNRKPYNQLSSRMSLFQHQLFIFLLAIKNIKLKYIYHDYCEEIDFNDKYIYFPAPYQPESVTAINSGVYEEIFLVLDMLSASTPKGWYIYYKEHPGTFRWFAKGALKRDRSYYERLSKYSNVRIINHQINSFKLIDNSIAVASMAGTSAWEAAIRNRPALSFGNMWHSGCNSIFTIKTKEDLTNAFIKIIDGFLPDRMDIENYVAAIEKIAVKNMIHRNFNIEIEKCSNPDYEIQKIANAIKDTHDRLYTSTTK